jgi:hypothetical protein
MAAEVDDVSLDLYVQAVAGLEAELLAGLAWYGDLVLGADLDAKHVQNDKHAMSGRQESRGAE